MLEYCDVLMTVAGEDSGTEQRDASDGLSAVLGQEWEWHPTNCTGDAWRSPACYHGQHDGRGTLLTNSVTFVTAEAVYLSQQCVSVCLVLWSVVCHNLSNSSFCCYLCHVLLMDMPCSADVHGQSSVTVI